MSNQIWDGEIEPPAPNQWLRLGGVLAAAALIAAIVGMRPSQVSPTGVLGYSLMQTVLLSAILYFTWMRDGPTWRPIATAAGLFVVIMLVNLDKADRHAVAVKADMATFGKLYFDAGGRLVAPPDPSSHGPFSRATIKLAKETEKLNDEYMLQLDQSGMLALFDANRIRVNPDMIKNCGAIIAVKSDIPKYKARHLALIEKGRRDFEDVDAESEMVEAVLRGMDSRMPQARSDIERSWDLNGQQIEAAHAACQVLARGNWHAQGTVFAFTSRSDMAAFDRHSDRLNDLAKQLETIADAGRQRMRAAQREMARGLK